MTDTPATERRGWSSPWRQFAFWVLAALGVPTMTAAWVSIEFAREEDAEAAHAGVSGGDVVLLMTLAFIAVAHVVGWAVLGWIALGAPGGRRRRTVLAVSAVLIVSGMASLRRSCSRTVSSSSPIRARTCPDPTPCGERPLRTDDECLEGGVGRFRGSSSGGTRRDLHRSQDTDSLLPARALRIALLHS